MQNKQTDKQAADAKTAKDKADSEARDKAAYTSYETDRATNRIAQPVNDLYGQSPQGQTAPAQGMSGTGGARNINDPSTMECRVRAVQYALQLHSGKGDDAARIVAEAVVFEAYLSGAPAKPTVAPDNVPKQNNATHALPSTVVPPLT